jgi:hypothetical protein
MGGYSHQAYVFKRASGERNMYLCDLDHDVIQRDRDASAFIGIDTVQKRKAKYSKKQLSKADMARKMVRDSTMTARQLQDLLRAGKIAMSEVTAADLWQWLKTSTGQIWQA